MKPHSILNFPILTLFGLFGIVACNGYQGKKQPAVRIASIISPAKITSPTNQHQTKDMVQLRSLAKAADRLFQKVWAGYWKDEYSRVNSVFGMIDEVLGAKFSDRGQPLRRKNSATEPCQDPDYHDFEVTPALVAGKAPEIPTGYTITEINCRGKSLSPTPLAEIKKKKNAQGVSGYEIKFAILESTLGRGILFFQGGSPSCEIYPGGDGKLQNMSCQDIGQNRDRGTFIFFSKFNVDVAKENPLTGHAEVYKIDKDGQKRLLEKIDLKDIPHLNRFEFNIERVHTVIETVTPAPTGNGNETGNGSETSTAVSGGTSTSASNGTSTSAPMAPGSSGISAVSVTNSTNAAVEKKPGSTPTPSGGNAIDSSGQVFHDPSADWIEIQNGDPNRDVNLNPNAMPADGGALVPMDGGTTGNSQNPVM